MEILKKFNQQLTQVLLVVAAVLAFLLCFLVVTDVIGRVVFNSPVKGTTEIVSLSCCHLLPTSWVCDTFWWNASRRYVC